jgi:hypothetical protein
MSTVLVCSKLSHVGFEPTVKTMLQTTQSCDPATQCLLKAIFWCWRVTDGSVCTQQLITRFGRLIYKFRWISFGKALVCLLATRNMSSGRLSQANTTGGVKSTRFGQVLGRYFIAKLKVQSHTNGCFFLSVNFININKAPERRPKSRSHLTKATHQWCPKLSIQIFLCVSTTKCVKWTHDREIVPSIYRP